ncbi:MAG: asparagine synthase (glutamine-hydrolyzing) [Bacteroidia bacterium]|jgi:asparagine synthase (glutamine-hydrolysing)|nr:asparagine synthase (glutamine-hydrolyzing) [Bacteroidia bacterium]
MCGIAGFLSFNDYFKEEDIQLMTDRIAHRGPDASGKFYDGTCGLGHRRLSIIDLSDRANQPMHSANDRYVIAYNGEVYNFQQIGAQLKESNADLKFKFRTSSDTEIILEAFVHSGIDFVHQLNGMFAIAIYDKYEKELYLIRDRLGIKPLMYYWDGQNLAFASEIKALTQLSQIDKEINNASIGDFLHIGFIPAPNTIYKKIFKLSPGSYLKIDKNGIATTRYWNIKQKLSNNIINSKEEALVKLSDLLMSSVQYQLRSDVPFGVFLSGGIDSSLVTAQAVNLSSVKVNTFSIGFEENSHNESEYAKAVANHLGTKHHEFIVSYKDAINLIDSIFEVYDELNADSSFIPTMLVSKLAKNYVTVTLSGEGGDELFFGYGSYQWARRLSSPLFNIIRKPMAFAFSHMSSRYNRIGKLLRTEDSINLMSHILSQEQYLFTTSEIKKIVYEPYATPGFINGLENFETQSLLAEIKTSSGTGVEERRLTAMEQQSLFDIQYYLPDDLLTKVDRSSMLFSLETRVPYLDHRVVEFAANLSPELKFHNDIPKYILKQILYKYVPEKLFNRPKQGFAIPLNKWLKKELKYLVEDYLNPEVIQRYGIVKLAEVEKLKQDFYNGRNYLYNRLWLLIILHKWMKENT